MSSSSADAWQQQHAIHIQMNAEKTDCYIDHYKLVGLISSIIRGSNFEAYDGGGGKLMIKQKSIGADHFSKQGAVEWN